MYIRLASPRDVPRLIEIRAAVRENRLRDLTIGAADYAPYIVGDHCWVWEEDGVVSGFAALDAEAASVWALFVAPEAEGRGIGRALLDALVKDARRRGLAEIRLITATGTRAEQIYLADGWETIDADANGNVVMRRGL